MCVHDSSRSLFHSSGTEEELRHIADNGKHHSAVSVDVEFERGSESLHALDSVLYLKCLLRAVLLSSSRPTRSPESLMQSNTEKSAHCGMFLLSHLGISSGKSFTQATKRDRDTFMWLKSQPSKASCLSKQGCQKAQVPESRHVA